MTWKNLSLALGLALVAGVAYDSLRPLNAQAQQPPPVAQITLTPVIIEGPGGPRFSTVIRSDPRSNRAQYLIFEKKAEGVFYPAWKEIPPNPTR
jgi:hypothetical protein